MRERPSPPPSRPGFGWGLLALSLLALHLPPLAFAAFFHRGHHFEDLLPLAPVVPMLLIAMIAPRSPGDLPLLLLGGAAVLVYHAVSITLLARGLRKPWWAWFAAGLVFLGLNLAVLTALMSM